MVASSDIIQLINAHKRRTPCVCDWLTGGSYTNTELFSHWRVRSRSPLAVAGPGGPPSAGWVAAELPGVVVASEGVSWLDVGVSSTGQIINQRLPVWRTGQSEKTRGVPSSGQVWVEDRPQEGSRPTCSEYNRSDDTEEKIQCVNYHSADRRAGTPQEADSAIGRRNCCVRESQFIQTTQFNVSVFFSLFISLSHSLSFSV